MLFFFRIWVYCSVNKKDKKPFRLQYAVNKWVLVTRASVFTLQGQIIILEAFPFRLIQMAPLADIDGQVDVHMAHRSLFALPTNGLLVADKSAHYWRWPRQLGCRPPEIALSHCGAQPCRWCRMAGFKCWHCIRHAPLRVLLKSLDFDPAVFEAESRNLQLANQSGVKNNDVGPPSQIRFFFILQMKIYFTISARA